MPSSVFMLEVCALLSSSGDCHTWGFQNCFTQFHSHVCAVFQARRGPSLRPRCLRTRPTWWGPSPKGWDCAAQTPRCSSRCPQDPCTPCSSPNTPSQVGHALHAAPQHPNKSSNTQRQVGHALHAAPQQVIQHPKPGRSCTVHPPPPRYPTLQAR